jgi:hypothetical protein
MRASREYVVILYRQRKSDLVGVWGAWPCSLYGTAQSRIAEAFAN